MLAKELAEGIAIALSGTFQKLSARGGFGGHVWFHTILIARPAGFYTRVHGMHPQNSRESCCAVLVARS
jgi:hypothetical protein